MTSVATVRIHASQFPTNVQRDLLASLRTRRVNHKFHYDSVKQTRKWLALHEAHSPARYDDDCRSTYDHAFTETAGKIKSKSVHVIGLGCGGGKKDSRLLALLQKRGKSVFYTPSDVSTAMVLVARQAALKVLPEKNCFPFVCDLATANNLPAVLATRHPSVVTFFGMIPNFEPQIILPRLARLVRPKDHLLFSANLAPGDNYAAGIRRILPQYDNPLTGDWLTAFLSDLGVEKRDGKLIFTIEPGGLNLQRIVAKFHFARACRVEAGGQVFKFLPGESIRLFFSYRYTPERVHKTLLRHGLEVCQQWISASEEEGIFLCRSLRTAIMETRR
ncbi:MAG TPA: L-histidine N(alpha)-methyltransferase [Candidatus Acidoferrales bacterium]|jgi:L-histidine N-alpha-methyltransferase|nr:L-histidine N(alpha)-methyltransferase [Candidatus Acidoferrales bacterium]